MPLKDSTASSVCAEWEKLLRGSCLHLLMFLGPLEQSQGSAPCWWRSRRTRGGSSRRCRGGCRLPCQGCKGPGVSWPAEHPGQPPARGTGQGHSERAAAGGNSSAPGDIPPHRPAWCLQGDSPSAPPPACPTAQPCLQYLQEQHHSRAKWVWGWIFKKGNLKLIARVDVKWVREEQTPQLVPSQGFWLEEEERHEYSVLHKKHKVHAPFGCPALPKNALSQPKQRFFLSSSSPLCHSVPIHFVDVSNQYLL